MKLVNIAPEIENNFSRRIIEINISVRSKICFKVDIKTFKTIRL